MRISLRSKREFAFQVFFMFTGLLIFISLLFDSVKNIAVDTTNKAIVIKSLFIPVTNRYSFTELDGYVDTILKHGNWDSYKCLCLVKNNVIILKIDSFYYSNIEEIQQSFTSLKYLGFRKSGLFNTTKLT